MYYALFSVKLKTLNKNLQNVDNEGVNFNELCNFFFPKTYGYLIKVTCPASTSSFPSASTSLNM